MAGAKEFTECEIAGNSSIARENSSIFSLSLKRKAAASRSNVRGETRISRADSNIVYHCRPISASSATSSRLNPGTRVRAKLELSAARLATALSELESTAAVEAAQRALLLFQKAGDELGAADAQSYLGLSLAFRGRIAEGKRMLAGALETAHAHSAQLIIGTTTNALAITYAVKGDYTTSRRLFREAVSVFKSAECDRIAAQITAGLAEAEYLAGNIGEAVQLSHEAGRVLRANRNWVTSQTSSPTVALTKLPFSASTKLKPKRRKRLASLGTRV